MAQHASNFNNNWNDVPCSQLLNFVVEFSSGAQMLVLALFCLFISIMILLQSLECVLMQTFCARRAMVRVLLAALVYLTVRVPTLPLQICFFVPQYHFRMYGSLSGRLLLPKPSAAVTVFPRLLLS
jgi:hypothetical protein